MATIQVILMGVPGGSIHDTDQYPVILHFEEGNNYDEAAWVIPAFPGYIPGDMLSEIRVVHGPLKVVVDGPGGFQSGPYNAAWIKGNYPRGKLCSFLDIDQERKVFSVTVEGGEIVVAEQQQMPTGNQPT
jgi:hypothetical protein